MTRTAKALASWLAPAWNSSFELRPDLDQIEALTSEREALWARIEKVSFLTLNEKRQAVGYAPLEEPPPEPATEVERSSVLRKYRSDQARAPRGQSDGGRWVDEGGGSGGGGGSSDSRSLSDANSDDADFWRPGARVAQAGGNRASRSSPILARFPEATAAQEVRWFASYSYAQGAIARAEAAIPGYRPRASLTSTIEGEIARNEADARDAEQAIRELYSGKPGGPPYRFQRPPPAPFEEVLSPSGTPIGRRDKSKGADTRTVRRDTFDSLVRNLTNGAQEIPTRSDYAGVWYRRTDGTVIGIRRSDQHGLTIDIIDSSGNPAFKPGTRIHFDD